MAIRPKLSKIVANQLPEFIREDYPTFVAFLEAYYEYLEQNDANPYELRDIDKTLDRFIAYFRNEVSPNAFKSDNIDERFLLSNIKDAHLAKGSEASFKLLFRLLYNKNVTVQYPGQQILRASDGKWNQDVSIFAKINAGNPNDIVGKLVDVITPNRIIRVLVDRRQDVEIEVDRFVQISPDTYEFYIDRRFFGAVSIGDRLSYGGTFDATITATTAKLTVLQRGKNFKPGQLYPLKNGAGSGSIIKIKSVDSNGGIAAAEFVKYGIGYETDFTATILALAGQTITGAGQTALNISRVASAVTSIEIVNGGSGYTSTPTVVLSGGGFTSAATIGAVTVDGGVITSIKVATPGNGYVTAPTVIITGGGGTGASATTTIGVTSNYGIFETTNGFSEQGYINLADYTQDVSTIWEPRKTYSTGDQLYWNSILYNVTSGGISSSSPPVHNTGSASNGTVTLEYSRVHGPAFDGTYSGDTLLREFYFDSKDAVIDPDDPAIIRVDLGPLTKYPGYYKNNDGFLDDAIFIQDSRYYQAYSYVLKIDERLESYKSIVKTLIHPSGLAMFGEYDIRNEFDIAVSLQSMLKILVINIKDEIDISDVDPSKIFNKVADEDEIVATDTTPNLLVQKSVTDSVTPSEAISKKDFSKSLDDSLLGFIEVHTIFLEKSLVDSISTPTDSISNKEFDKALTETITVPDVYKSLISKPLDDSISTPTDSISNKEFSKAVADSISTPTDSISNKEFSKAVADSISTPTDSISNKEFSKAVADSIALSDNDTLLITKYNNDTISLTDSGNLFLNPYVAENYWVSDYTIGELPF